MRSTALRLDGSRDVVQSSAVLDGLDVRARATHGRPCPALGNQVIQRGPTTRSDVGNWMTVVGDDNLDTLPDLCKVAAEVSPQLRDADFQSGAVIVITSSYFHVQSLATSR